jgi:hypothetical protein
MQKINPAGKSLSVKPYITENVQQLNDPKNYY